MEATPRVHRQRHRRRDASPVHRRHGRQNSNNSAVTPTTPTTTTTTTTTATTMTTATAIAADQTTARTTITTMAIVAGNTTTPTSTTAATTATAATTIPTAGTSSVTSMETRGVGSILAAEEGCAVLSDATHSIVTAAAVAAARITTRLSQENERQSSADSIEMVGSPSQTSQQTVVLVNGHVPPSQETSTEQQPMLEEYSSETYVIEKSTGHEPTQASHLDSPTQPKVSDGSRNSSGDAMSLRETLQQLPPTLTGHGHRHHSHHSRRTHSPQSPASRALEADSSFHRGILGYMDRELKQSSPTPSALSVGGASSGGGGGGGGGLSASAVGGGASRKLQTLSDPQASPAQRSLHSRGSLEKSPRRKRSKSESRRRRERKLIAAGEMEVRQANETLMRYLKQCTEMNDASLSGELEIDKNYDERRVHRKTKSQRDKRGHLISKLYSAGGLSSILKELSDDIVPAEGEEIYNPFTPVVSPTDDTPAHIDKMFLQTSSGYRPVEHCYYKRSFVGAHRAGGSAVGVGIDAGIDEGGVGGSARLLRASASYGDTRCLLDSEFNGHEITSHIQLSCVIQRIWLLISNICHGLLAGLALAHLLFVVSSHPMDWSKVIKVMSLAGETIPTTTTSSTIQTSASATLSTLLETDIDAAAVAAAAAADSKTDALSPPMTLIGDYAAFADIYLNTFYCLAIVCMVSVLDRIDICRWSFSNATEIITFRWLIITMIYIATIILTICSDSIDEKLYLFHNNNANVTLTQQEMLSNSVQSVWSSLSVTRSIAAICGWIMIGLTPNEDLLYEHLVDLAKYQLTNN